MHVLLKGFVIGDIELAKALIYTEEKVDTSGPGHCVLGLISDPRREP